MITREGRRADRSAGPRPAGTGATIRADRGSATVEFAVCLPALVLLLGAGLTSVSAVRTQIECVDAAREGALAAARGSDGAAAARRVAPAGAAVSVGISGNTVEATVSVRIAPMGGRMTGFTVSGSAVAAVEPGMP